MAAPEANVFDTQLQTEIKMAGDALGLQMAETLPPEFNFFAWLLRAHQVSPCGLVPQEGQNGAFTRVWLERKTPRRAGGASSIELLTDVVTVGPLSGEVHPRARQPEVAAVFDNKTTKVAVTQELGTPLEQTLERIHQLGTYVAAVAQAGLDEKLRRVVPARYLPSPRPNA